MRKILGLTIVAVLVMALVGGGTWAYFNDPETSTGNVLTAGTLDLSLDGADVNVVMLTLGNLKPGDDDAGSPGTVNLKNVGSITADMTIATGVVSNTESTGTTGTADSGTSTTMADDALTQLDDYWVGYTLTFTSGSNSGESRRVTGFVAGTDTITVASAFTNAVANGDAYALYTEYERDVAGSGGELGAEVDIALWLDTNGSGSTYEVGTDKRLDPDGTFPTDALVFYPLNSYTSKTWTDCITGLTAGSSVDFYVEWDFVNEVTSQNTAQGDSASVGFTFTLTQ